jgi:hypothetical protein
MTQSHSRANPQDATLRNVRAAKTRTDAAARRLRALMRRVAALEASVEALHERQAHSAAWTTLHPSPPPGSS